MGRTMRKTAPPHLRKQSLLAAAVAFTALAAPPVRAQTAEEFKQLKALVEQLQKTIDAQNARIGELEKNQPAKPPAPPAPPAAVPPAALPALAAETSPSFRTVEKVAAGGQVGQKSPVTDRGALDDKQEAASRPKDFTL